MTFVSGYRMIFNLFKLEKIYNLILYYLIHGVVINNYHNFKNDEYGQEMPQSQTAGQAGMAP